MIPHGRDYFLTRARLPLNSSTRFLPSLAITPSLTSPPHSMSIPFSRSITRSPEILYFPFSFILSDKRNTPTAPIPFCRIRFFAFSIFLWTTHLKVTYLLLLVLPSQLKFTLICIWYLYQHIFCARVCVVCARMCVCKESTLSLVRFTAPLCCAPSDWQM